MCIYTHTCTLTHAHSHKHTQHKHVHTRTCAHTHTHTHTMGSQSFTHQHQCFAIAIYLSTHIQNIKLFLAVILFITCFSFVFLLEPYLFLNCLVYQCARLCMHTHTHHTQALAYTCNCSHMFIVCVNLCFLICSGNYQQVF